MRIKKALYYPFLLLLYSSLLGGCKNNDSSSSSQKQRMNAIEFHQAIMLHKDIQLIDVRTPEEIANGFIPNAQFIDFKNVDFKNQILSLEEEKPVYIYCAAGGRSEKAAKLLIKNGFTHVYDLSGGFSAWQKHHLPVIEN